MYFVGRPKSPPHEQRGWRGPRIGGEERKKAVNFLAQKNGSSK